MSLEWSEAVRKNSNSRLGVRLVLLELADHANSLGECWPSVDRIAERTRLNRRNVQRAISDLIELGELTADRSGGRKRPSRYQIILPLQKGGETYTLPEHSKGDETYTLSGVKGDKTNIKGDKTYTKGRQNIHPNRKEPLKNRKSVGRAEPPSLNQWLSFCEEKYSGWPSEDITRLWNYYESLNWRKGNTPIANWKALVGSGYDRWQSFQNNKAESNDVQTEEEITNELSRLKGNCPGQRSLKEELGWDYPRYCELWERREAMRKAKMADQTA